MDSIPRLTAQEIVYAGDENNISKKKMLCPEQKYVACLMTLMDRFSNPGDLVFGPFAGTYSTARACLLLPAHRRCIVSNIDPNCKKHAFQQLVDVFARQVLNGNSDITGTDKTKKAAAVFINTWDAIRAKRQVDAWCAPPGLPSMQIFPTHIHSFLSCYHEDYGMSSYWSKVAYTKWPLKYRNRLKQMDPKSLLTHELCTLGLQLRPSTIPGAGLGLFTSRPFGKGEFIGSNYSRLLYNNMAVTSKDKPTAYGEGVMAVESEEFLNWAVELYIKTACGNTIWIFPAPFCAMRLTNDPRYTADEPGRPTDEELNNNPQVSRSANVEWVERRQPITCASDLKNPNLLRIRCK